MNNNKRYSAFNLNRAMRFVTITTITSGLSICFIEANPAGAAIITVPFNWQLQMSGLSYAQSIVVNRGPASTPKSDPETLTALIKVIANHRAPANARRLDPLPQRTSLNITGSFSGELGGTCVPLISNMTGVDCYSKASASLTSPVSFTASRVWPNSGVLPFDIPLNQTLNVAAGDYPITGSVIVDTLFGLGRGSDVVYGDATLRVNSRFSPGVQTTFNIRYETVPEPLTILGSATALGLGAFFKRKVSRKPKKN
jgi:hypothetical protein